MSVGLLLITHNQIGQQMLLMATTTLGRELPINYEIVQVPMHEPIEKVTESAQSAIKRLNCGDGVLIMTDLYGATPGNIACRLMGSPGIRVITGLNLPMLIKIVGYVDQDLDTLTQAALKGAKEGIILCNEDLCQLHQT